MKFERWSIDDQAFAHLSASPVYWISRHLNYSGPESATNLHPMRKWSYDDMFDVAETDILRVAREHSFVPPGENVFTMSYGRYCNDGPSIYFKEDLRQWVWSLSSRGDEFRIEAASDNLAEVERAYIRGRIDWLKQMFRNHASAKIPKPSASTGGTW